MKPLYTAEEQYAILCWRHELQSRNCNTIVEANVTLRAIGHRAALRSWRRKAEKAYATGYQDAINDVRDQHNRSDSRDEFERRLDALDVSAPVCDPTPTQAEVGNE